MGSVEIQKKNEESKKKKVKELGYFECWQKLNKNNFPKEKRKERKTMKSMKTFSKKINFVSHNFELDVPQNHYLLFSFKL